MTMHRRKRVQETAPGALRACAAALVFVCAPLSTSLSQPVDHVIHISVDGLRPDAVTYLGPALCPNFHRLMVEGAFTLNARTDFDYTNTLPNHTCQITGRGVLGEDGHSIFFNDDSGGTIEDAHGSYVAGIFDAVHDNTVSTALFSGKSKFDLFERSWDAVNGAADTTGSDDGRDKIDHYLILEDTQALVDSFVSLLGSVRPGYAFLHLRDPDSFGHAYGWTSPEYLDAVMRMDSAIGAVMAAAGSDQLLSQSTAVIVTADHGGTGTDHSDETDPRNYTVPVFVTGPGVPAGMDIYLMNPLSRLDPGGERPDYNDPVQPVRNGDCANLEAGLLGLGPVPGSTIGSSMDLEVTAPEGSGLPSVSITWPPEGWGFDAGVPVTVEVDAAAQGGISRVEFFLDWESTGEDASPPWSYTYDEVPLGDRILTARAFDDAGLASTASVSVAIESVASSEERPGWDSRAVVSPNPVDASSRVMFYLPEPGPVEVKVYDAAGRLAGRFLSPPMAQGLGSLLLDTRGLAPGIYFFRAIGGGETASGKFVLIR